MQVTEPTEAVNAQCVTMMQFEGANEAGVNQSTLEIQNKTGGSMRNVSTVKGINIDASVNIDDTKSRDIQQSAAEFALVSAKASVKSHDTAEVVSKGGNVPDQYRDNHRRRDNYLTTLLSQKLSEKTNILSRMQQQAPMKVKINESHQEIQKFAHSTGRITLGLEKAMSLHSSDQNYYDPHRIQLNSVDIKMMKNSFIEPSRRRLNSGDQESNLRERLNSMASKDDKSKDSMIALTQYAKRQPSAEMGGFPLITKSIQNTNRGDMQIDIGIKNGHAKEIEDEVIQIGSTQLSRSDAKYSKRHLKGVSVDIPKKSSKMPLPLGSAADKRNEVSHWIASEMEKDHRMISPGNRFRRPQAHQIIMESYDTTLDSSKMHVYNSKNYQPNSDVTRLLVNPEQALKKNLKPIKTSHNKDRPPLRSLFSTRQSKKGRSPLQSSFQQDSTRYRHRQSPTAVLQLSHDVKIAMKNQNTELSTLGGLHERNMTQLPAGGKYPQNQQIFESLDTTTKLDLLRKTKYDTHSNNSPHKSLAKIIETAHKSGTETSQIMQNDLSSAGDMMSVYSQQDGVFYQPDKIKGEHKMGQLKLALKSPQIKSPFRPPGTGLVSQLMTAPGTSEPLIENIHEENSGLLNTLPGTANYSNALTAGANNQLMNLSQSVHMPNSNLFDKHMPVIMNNGDISTRNIQTAPRQDSIFSKMPHTSPSKEWIYVPNPSVGSDTSRVLKKKHHVMQLDQIRLLEQRIKEQKRNNEKLAQKVKDRTNAMHQQEQLTERIMEYKRRQNETVMTLQMSIDRNTNAFNPSITDNSLSMHQSIDNEMESSVKQSQVHSLYKKLITGDLETSKQKTEVQLNVERWNVEQAYVVVEELQEENKILKRNIKRAKEVLENKQEKVKKKERKLAAIEKGVGRNSDLDSNSLKDTDNHSMASFSALGGYGSQRIDIKKVEQINQNVSLIVASKTPLETMLQILKTFKQAIKNVGRCTIYVINRYLQAYVFKNMHEHKRFFKAIQMGGRNSIVYAIYQDSEEYCKPTFTSIQGAAKPQYTQRLIYIPVFYDQLLMFAIQLESDAPTAATIGNIGGNLQPVPAGVRKGASHQIGEIKSKANSLIARSMTVRSKPSQASKMSDGFSVSRRANPLRSMWNNNDFTVCKIICTLVKARMQIFTYNIQKEHKQKMKARVVRFVTGFIQHRTFKSLIAQVKTDLPKLLGFKEAEVFSYDHPTKQLYCMSIRPDQNAADADLEKDPPGFEEEYIIDENQVVRFPTHMGVSGFALTGDAVCYINDFAHKKATVIGPIVPDVSSSRQQILSLPEQATSGQQLAKDSPYNRKIDNFLELESVENFVISSIQDEEVLGKPRAMGIIQLFNRVASDILQDDLVRIHYIRKLIGSMMMSCEMYSITFELTVGMARAQEQQNMIKEMAAGISYGHINNLKQSIQTMQRRLEEGSEEHQKDQLETISEEKNAQ